MGRTRLKGTLREAPSSLSHMAEVPSAKRQRLTHNKWEDIVLDDGTDLPSHQLPFVNRQREIFELFHVNAKVIRFLLQSRLRRESSIGDWRPCSLAVAAQMFGSGKTALGRNFTRQLKEPVIEPMLENEVDAGTLDEWKEELKLARQAKSTRHDLTGCATLC